MIYKVERKDDKIYIKEKITSIEGLKRGDYFEVDCDEVNEVIKNSLGSRQVIINVLTKGLEFEDEKYYDIPVKDNKRVNIIKQAKTKMESLVGSIDMITYINYIDINNELYNYGIFITDDNREEKYLEILETGDEHKIDLLEDLLLTKDKLSVVKSAKEDFDKIVENVKRLSEDDSEELKALFEMI